MAIYRGSGGSTSTTDQATIDQVAEDAATATTKATEAANSATAAATSASSASTSATSATTSATSASTSASNASISASNASTSASNASSSATAAAASATSASSSATNAAAEAAAALSSKALALDAQTAAETAESNASDHADDAVKAAYGAVDTLQTLSDTSTIYSARHYASKTGTDVTAAAASAAAAAASETAAAASETAAADSETAAAGSATAAATSATAAASSATSASGSASTATTKASEASTSATAAAASETAAAASETAAADSETAAATSETNAANSASAASTSATNASTSASAAAASETAAAASATSASTSASTATTQASNALTSATNAAASETAAAASETAAAASETAAASSASTASTQATNAASSATSAASSATTATTKASEASTSATNAASSATAAASSASAAQAAEDAALAALDSFDDRYLGQKTSDPTLDNDGNALVAGALYFNTTDSSMKVYDGSSWLAAYASLSGALLAANNLSDLVSASAARTNLGLGTAATTASTDYATAAQGTLADSALQSSDIGVSVQGYSSVLAATTASYTTAEETKLSGIEAGADVTDTANVTAAGALMDSEVTNLAQVKAFSSADYATAAQGALADSALQDITGESIEDLSDVATMTPTDGQLLTWDSTTSKWNAEDAPVSLPDQTGSSGYYLTTNGTSASWDALATVANSGAYSDLSGTPTNVSTFTNDSGYLTGNQTITLSGDASGSGTTSIAVTVANDSHSHSTSTITGLGTLATLSSVNASTITDNSVGAAELNVTGNGTTSQFLRSDGDGTFTWATPTDTNTTYTAGTGLTLSTTTFSVNYGTTSGTACQGNDSRLSNSRQCNNSFDNAATARTNLGLGSLATLSAVGAAQITDNTVGAAELNVSGNGTTSQFLRSDGDGTFTWATPTDTNTTYSAGAGLDLTGTTFSIESDLRDNVQYVGRDGNDYIYQDGSNIRFYINGAEDWRMVAGGTFHADGDVIAYSSTISDERLKENIVGIDDALSKVAQLNGYTFSYKADGKISAGVIAQEVEKVLPEAVSETELPLKADDGKEYKVVNYDALHGLLIEAVKELTKRVEELENK